MFVQGPLEPARLYSSLIVNVPVPPVADHLMLWDDPMFHDSPPFGDVTVTVGGVAGGGGGGGGGAAPTLIEGDVL